MAKKRQYTNVKILNQYMEIDFDTIYSAEVTKNDVKLSLEAGSQLILPGPGPENDYSVVSSHFLSISVVHITPATEDLTTEE